MVYSALRLLLAGALVASLAACGEDPFEVPTAPSTPTTVTETFAGTIARNGAATHSFTTQASGTLTATLSSLGPDSAAVMGMSLGTWNGNVCQIVLAKDDATQGSVITGGVSASGFLCVRLYDVGNVASEPFTYEVTVVHP
jgi:hypothetical protein